MSDLVGNPGDRFSHNEALIVSEDCYISEEYESGYDLTGYCFLNSPYTLFQNNAEEFCQKIMGYRLVTINSKRKQWAVAAYVKGEMAGGLRVLYHGNISVLK